MTRVEFIVNLQSTLQKTVALCENYLNKGHVVTINCVSEAQKASLSSLLYDQRDISFLPHVDTHDADADITPIHFHMSDQKPLQDDILINLGSHVPLFFGRFRQMIEVVGDSEEALKEARERFKFYRDRGYTLQSTDAKKQKTQ